MNKNKVSYGTKIVSAMRLQILVSIMFLMLCSHNISAQITESAENTKSAVSFSGGPTIGFNNSNFIHSGVEDCSSINI